MKSSSIILLFVLTITFGANSQKSDFNFSNYRIENNHEKGESFVFDTITNSKTLLKHKYANHFIFRHGFIQARCGDMKGLLTVKGEILLNPSHFIRFNIKDSLISAYVCHGREWIFLDFSGDTISFGIAPEMNYCPSLENALTPAPFLDKTSDQILFGYLTQKAEWFVLPYYQNAREFINGIAKVKTGNKWGAINENGLFVIEPTFDTEDFEIEQ